ncbi:bifunctional diaminohydroxyphosphoribosylaminopyrimidine deaminase/5-amino-6-(5-phosphoribosylamino)uracil reductase RibD [Iamia majanohamensis]|uniref:Riboflavin biosynthesis protein RibD n=1 Tax=Iamia majanohamensis TaxID=467976 RepID=A0AAF0BU55_9ACTN|nr:bifunctional diaminohydroxyphosphoribosylaminopyrimidine deaminase/5-amino-6-(5-phosphoribosylamino)uracil reductase RibD [Iamia majanohamensis]WCO65139.1 bifunctional diaminohydroxyphosphoribosylaminopyrimidine deaminase/5-amino-6-(5-phosphoribosylamino)uracil reductase RibD [Iamia majanohamensis]
MPDTADETHMATAVALAEAVRTRTAPNPWVGAVLVTVAGAVHTGATEPPGGRHAEVVALDAARAAEGPDAAVGATVHVTLEPCAHQGRTGPCADALIAAGVARVVVAVADPDTRVAGEGIERLRAAGVAVEVGCRADEVAAQLAAYLHHRRTGRPLVVLKLAATLDGRTAAADGTSQWITGVDARTDAHRLRAESQAIVVGSGTVTADDPTLTTRLVEGPDPRRVVLGTAPAGARVHPCLEWGRADGDLGALLDRLGAEGVLQVLVEGGATVATAFHRAGLVDRYVLYLAPALAGGDDGPGLFRGPGLATITDLWRGRIAAVDPVGDDLRVDLRPVPARGAA